MKDEPGVTYVMEDVALSVGSIVDGNHVKVVVRDQDHDRDVVVVFYSPEGAVEVAKRLIINAAKIQPELGGVYYFYKEEKEPT